MTITLNGTTGVAGVDGTAATPAIQGNDTNTGIFFPAADTIAFAEGGAEVARFDSSGNLGVGTTSPAAKIVSAGSSSTVYKALILRNGDGTTGSSATIDFEASTGTQGDEASMAGRIAGVRTGSGTSGALTFSTTNAGVLGERMRIDSSGNFLVGTTNHLYANTSRANIRATSNQYGASISSLTGGFQAITVINEDTSGTRYFTEFRINANGATGVGSITSTGSTTAYNTTSDYRLKENIAPMTGALAKVSALKPCTYTWKETGEKSQGFIAHELAEVVPDAVVGEKDAVNEDGSIKPQGIDTSFLVATLTCAIQELKAELDTVKTELATLKGTA